MITHRTASEEETIAFGQELSAGMPTDSVVLLIGELGSGKTTLAKGLVSGFGVSDPGLVHSPTFSLVHEYPTADGPVYHIDLYRLETRREQASIGLEEIVSSGRPVLIEWADRLHTPPQGAIEIRIRGDDGGRSITMVG